MPWFKVDDSFYDHPKIWDAPDCAVALWVRAGSWSARSLTDGFVPSKMPTRFCDDPDTAVRELLARGLWLRARGGYVFHDWSEYQPTREEATAAKAKKSSGGRIGNHRRWHVSRGVSDPDCAYCQGKQVSDNRSESHRTTDRFRESGPNPPVPSRPDRDTSLSTQLPVDARRALNGEREKDQREGRDNPETQTLKTMVELGASVAEATRIIGDIRREGRIHSPAGWLASETGRADFAERLAGIRPSAAAAPPARLGCDDCHNGWLNDECTKPCLRCKPHLARRHEGVTP